MVSTESVLLTSIVTEPRETVLCGRFQNVSAVHSSSRMVEVSSEMVVSSLSLGPFLCTFNHDSFGLAYTKGTTGSLFGL